MAPPDTSETPFKTILLELSENFLKITENTGTVSLQQRTSGEVSSERGTQIEKHPWPYQ